MSQTEFKSRERDLNLIQHIRLPEDRGLGALQDARDLVLDHEHRVIIFEVMLFDKIQKREHVALGLVDIL